MSFRFPYVSLDIETTGLDRQKSHVLQLAAVYDNGRRLEDLPSFNVVIKWPVITHAEEYAMNMNRELLERAFKNKGVVSINQAREEFSRWLDKVQPHGKLTAAGKNAQGFDLPILKNPVNQFDLRRFLHRVLDPGSMFADEFNHVPNQDEINLLTGRKEVSHDALDDCWDVVHAIRYKWRV
jgi:oligoribonuclease (3'-5' exoribonuclease)